MGIDFTNSGINPDIASGWSHARSRTLFSNGGKRSAITFQRGVFAGEGLPPLDHYIDVLRIEFDPQADAPRDFGGRKCGSAPQKGIVNQFSAYSMVHDG